MKLYSYDQVLADACQHEGVQIEHNVHHHGVMYTRLYSETFPRLNGDATANDVLEHVKKFMCDQSYMIPKADISPTEFGHQYKLLVYRLIGSEADLCQLSIEFISGHNDTEDLLSHLRPDSCENALCVIFVKEREVSYHKRILN